jgi:hypothetical protein
MQRVTDFLDLLKLDELRIGGRLALSNPNPTDNFQGTVMSRLLNRCLAAARTCVYDPDVVNKADFPTRSQFDKALEKLANGIWRDDEQYCKAFIRAADSEEGQLLYYARERAAPDPQEIRKAESIRLTKAETAIETEVVKYVSEHPGTTKEKAFIRVLDANPKLYRAYLLEKPDG